MISVLGNQITGKPGQVIVRYLPAPAFAYIDHFAGVGKMMGRFIPYTRSGRLR